VIVVGECDAHALADVVEKPGARRDVFERAVAPVAIQPVWQSLEGARMTVDGYPTSRIAARPIRFSRPFHVVDDHQVQPPIVVVVEPSGRNGPVAARDSRAGGDVFEPAVTEVSQELVLSDSRHEEIDVPVVVVVRGCRAHRIADPPHGGAVGHVREAELAVIAIEAICVRGAGLLEGRRIGAVREENVRPPVAVVVEDGESAWGALHEVPARRRRIVMYEAHARRLRYVPEVHASAIRTRLGARYPDQDEPQDDRAAAKILHETRVMRLYGALLLPGSDSRASRVFHEG
jgi:hypothetical protein